MPSPEATFKPELNSIVGNCSLYGATGGTFYARGIAGIRFALRNSGATAVAEGAGMDACECLTRGRVIFLGDVGSNVGAGMTGGCLFLPPKQIGYLNAEYLRPIKSTAEEWNEVPTEPAAGAGLLADRSQVKP